MAHLSDTEFQRLGRFIESEVGIKMPPQKRIMLEGRLNRRLRALGMDSYQAYLDYLFSAEQKTGELVHMIDAVTTNKTDFFREKDHFDFLSSRVLSGYFGTPWLDGRRQLRVWSSACSSGEEVYTLAMTIAEHQREQRDLQFRILGTDVSQTMVDTARRGVYPLHKIDPIPDVLRRRYLKRSKDPTARLVRIIPELRKNTVFRRMNLMHVPYPIQTTFDVIFCRNVIIYFDRPRQQQLVHNLLDYLEPGGFLFLGHSETLAGMGISLESVVATVYRKPLELTREAVG